MLRIPVLQLHPDRFQGIEQKMRMDLILQRDKFCALLFNQHIFIFSWER